MATVERKTKRGATIKATVTREVIKDTVNVDGMVAVNRKPLVVERVEIACYDPKGEWLGTSDKIDALGTSKQDKDAAAHGMIGKIGRMYMSAETAKLATDALAEAEAAEPGSPEFWAAKESRSRWMEESIRRDEDAERRRRMMDDPNSDY